MVFGGIPGLEKVVFDYFIHSVFLTNNNDERSRLLMMFEFTEKHKSLQYYANIINVSVLYQFLLYSLLEKHGLIISCPIILTRNYSKLCTGILVEKEKKTFMKDFCGQKNCQYYRLFCHSQTTKWIKIKDNLLFYQVLKFYITIKSIRLEFFHFSTLFRIW